MYPAWLLAGALLTVAAALAVVYLSLASRPQQGRWVAECLDIKDRLVQARSPRIVILSGSNSLFGFSARRLSEKYGIESVNAAIHAGLGISYILHYGRRYFAPGRLFVLPLEYELYGGRSNGQTYQYQVIGFDPGYFLKMSFFEKLVFTRDIAIVDRFRLLKAKIRSGRADDDGGEAYQSRNLNPWGDETSNSVSNATSEKLGLVKRQAAKSRSKKLSIDDAAWGELASFVRDAEAAGSRVVLAYPNLYAGAIDFDENRDFFTELEARAAKLHLPIIGDPKAYMFPDGHAYDTIYHQNSLGQAAATDRLYRDIAGAGDVGALRRVNSPRSLKTQTAPTN